jgi:hypothetical protein
MFRSFKTTFRNTIACIKAAFRLFIDTVQANTGATRSNTISVEALRDEQKALRQKLDTLVEHSAFQVRAKRAELGRQGHRVE